MSKAGALKRLSSAFVRVFIDLSRPTYINYRVIGADLAAHVYGRKEAVLNIHYVMSDEREQQVRDALKSHRAVPPAPADTSEPIVALSGFGWKHIVEHDDPADPAGELFEISRFFGTPPLDKVIALWEMIEPRSAERILAHLEELKTA